MNATGLRESWFGSRQVIAYNSSEVVAADPRLPLLREHGSNSLAYSSLQFGISYFLKRGKGYVAYSQAGKFSPSTVVLSDPVASSECREKLIGDFLKEFANPVFLHISKETATILSKAGFYVNELGIETILDVQRFDLVGNKKQHLRRARNCGEKDELKVLELGARDLRSDAVKEVSSDWLKSKRVDFHELKFLTRPAIYEDEADVRKFYALKDGRVVAFVFFDPIYENGKVVGYIANNLRCNLHRSYSVTDYIIIRALEVFKAEGVKELSLGLSPLSDVFDDGEFRYSPVLKAHFNFCFDHANFLFSFRNLAIHKKRYRPDMPGAREEKVYCASRSQLPLLEMYRVFCLMGLRPVIQTADYVREAFVAKMKSWCVEPSPSTREQCAQ